MLDEIQEHIKHHVAAKPHLKDVHIRLENHKLRQDVNGKAIHVFAIARASKLTKYSSI